MGFSGYLSLLPVNLQAGRASRAVGCRVLGLGFQVWGLGLMAKGLGFQGLGFRA